MNQIRALESDTAAWQAKDEDLIGLLMLRQAALTKISDDHPDKVAIQEARDSAKRELLYRLGLYHEYQEMAAIACLRIDMLDDVKHSSHVAEHIKIAKQYVEDCKKDPVVRHSLFEASKLVFQMAAASKGK